MALNEQPNRARPVRKSLTFSEVEWTRAQRRQEVAGTVSFSTFARQAILENEIKVTRVAFDPSALRVELSRIGNNINQIARTVNIEGGATYEEVRAVRILLGQIQDLISDAIGRPVEGGD